MSTPLDAIPDHTDVLIDTNVFVYGLTHQSAQCENLLRRCSNEQLNGVTLFEVVHEATHDFMRAEARQKGVYTAVEKGAKYLAKHPEEVKRLTDYWINTQRLLALNLVLLPMEEKIVAAAQNARLQHGLLTIDSIILAAMREYGLVQLATRDAQFNSVTGINVFLPTDI